MNYIVMDLEWNQGDAGFEEGKEELLFEIVEIGAVKLDQSGIMAGEFSELVKPAVYHHMHQMTGKLIHLRMRELEKGRPFVQVAEGFLEWCGKEPYQFCTWGGMDLTELQRNMKFHHMEALSDGPIAFLDVQKLFSIAYEDGKSRRALESAVDFLRLEKDVPFHRALSDAFYTAKILGRILEEKSEVLKNLSYDVFHLPADKKSELKIQFDTYLKYISREFGSKSEAFTDREVVSSRCYLCHRNLRKKENWFTPNGKNYYCLAYCEKHGYLKGKIRLRKSEDGGLYVVKTTKLISEAEADSIKERSRHIKAQHKYGQYNPP